MFFCGRWVAKIIFESTEFILKMTTKEEIYQKSKEKHIFNDVIYLGKPNKKQKKASLHWRLPNGPLRCGHKNKRYSPDNLGVAEYYLGTCLLQVTLQL